MTTIRRSVVRLMTISVRLMVRMAVLSLGNSGNNSKREGLEHFYFILYFVAMNHLNTCKLTEI